MIKKNRIKKSFKDNKKQKQMLKHQYKYLIKSGAYFNKVKALFCMLIKFQKRLLTTKEGSSGLKVRNKFILT